MKKHFILDKTKLKEGILFCLGIEENIEDIATKYKNYIVYTGEEYINFYWYYDEATESIKEKTDIMLLKEGIYKLRDGEKIIDDKLVYIEQPSKYHTWDGSEWIVDLEELREIKREEFKQEREKRQNELLEFKGNLYQVDYVKDFKNIELIQSKLTRLRLRGIDTTEYFKQKIKWTLANNEDIELTISDVLDLADAYTDRYQLVHYTCNQVLYPKIALAKTAEEIMNLKWE